jgi:hypothetical protein
VGPRPTDALTTPSQVTTTAKFDASLKLKSDVVPVEIGPSAAREQKIEYVAQQPYLEAHREGTAQPSWIFTRTPSVEVRGVQRLRTVVELATDARARAELSAGATLKLKLLGFIPYRAKLDDLPENQSIVFPT